jgi:hypothetical protein
VPKLSFKFIVKTWLSPEYRDYFKNLCGNNERTEAYARRYYEERAGKDKTVSLKELRSYLNYSLHPFNSLDYKAKEAFLHFYVWYLRRLYTVHILTSKDILYKE